MYKLSTDRTGLHCSATGLTYGALPLVTKSASNGRFEPSPADQLHKIGLAVSPSGLKAIAMALNDNSLARAMIGALHLKLPPLDSVMAGKLAKAGYRDDEARDDQGRWTVEDEGDHSAPKAEVDNLSVENNSDYQLIADNMTADQYQERKRRYVDAYLYDAQQAADALGVPVENVLAASAVESTWGESRFAVQGDNFFGLHSPAPHENKDKTMIAEKSGLPIAGFDSYGNSAQSFVEETQDFAHGLDDPKKFAEALQNSGKFGINEDGSKRKSYVPDMIGTIEKLRPIVAEKSRKL